MQKDLLVARQPDRDAMSVVWHVSPLLLLAKPAQQSRDVPIWPTGAHFLVPAVNLNSQVTTNSGQIYRQEPCNDASPNPDKYIR